MKGKIGVISIVALMLFGMLATLPIQAPPANCVYYDPATKDLSGMGIGDTFTVLIKANIADPPALYSWQIKTTFPDWLDAIDAKYACDIDNPTFPHTASHSRFFHGHTTVPLPFTIDNTPGAKYVLGGESLQGVDRASGDYMLMYITFRIVDAPGKMENWAGELSCNNDDTIFLDPTQGDVSPFDKTYTCELTFNWVQPATRPKMGWAQTYIGFDDPMQNYNCTNVDKEVMIKNLASGWDLTAASFIVHLELDTWEEYVSHELKPNWVGSAIWDEGTGTITVDVTWAGGAPPSGNVPVLDIVLHIYGQQGYGWEDTNVDTITDVALANHQGPIPFNPSETCTEHIVGYLTRPRPWLEVGDIVVGPGPVVCTTVRVPVYIKGLDPRWQLIGVQFRIGYDTYYVEPECADEGPFLPSFVNDGELGTFFIVFHEPDDFGPHTLIGDLILPDENGVWHAPFPEGNGILAWINLHIYHDPWPNGLVMDLPILWETGAEPIFVGLDENQNIIDVPIDVDKCKDGTLTIYHELPGRVIDVYGGLECNVFPAPYGGQGPNKPMDMVYPQKEVCLHVDVSYNFWPVQQKDVGFEIEGPYIHGTNTPKQLLNNTFFRIKLTNRTDADGHTWVKFRMPWPCVNPDEMLGQYKVTVTVDIACVVVNDTLVFDYDYVQRFFKVTVGEGRCGTNNFWHCDEVPITVEFGTYAQQYYPELLVVVIYDELGVPIGIAMVEMEIGGAKFCSYKMYKVTVKIHIPKWAFVGVAKIHVMCFDKDPTVGGTPWCPEYTPYPEIFIAPY
jgi:hypothetical protein